jgi:hypothetical protein
MIPDELSEAVRMAGDELKQEMMNQWQFQPLWRGANIQGHPGLNHGGLLAGS